MAAGNRRLAPATPPKSPDGDPAPFAALYERHAKFLYYLALRMLGSPALAEDATHDVFLKAFRALPRFRGESDVRTWLYRIAIHHCQNLLSSWQKRHVFPVADDGVLERAAPGADPPLRILEIKELGERVQKTLDALPEEYRLLLLLMADESLTYEGMGAVTGQSADSVRGKLYRARKAFIAAFERTEASPP